MARSKEIGDRTASTALEADRPGPMSPMGVSVTSAAVASGRFAPSAAGDTLRTRAARGTIVNTVFTAAVNGLGLLKGYVVAAFLPASDYGVWGLLVITLGTLLWLGQVGFDDKYIQQDSADQQEAFELAFTMQCALAGAFVVLVLVTMPLFALLYGNWSILAPAYVLALAMPATALQVPLWSYYRRMDFRRQRILQSFDPLASFVVTVALAVAGLGYWALVVGTVCGSYAAGFAAMRRTPYPLRLRYRRGTAREYLGFSWPLFLASLNGILIAQVPAIVAQRALGLAAVGAISLAATIGLYATRMDEIVSHALYPAICAAKDRLDILHESFAKSNRVALLWAVPTGVGVALFAPDLVRYVLGRRWSFATLVIQVMALSAVVNQVAFNWDMFYRAIGRTRPLAVASFAMTLAALGFSIPLILTRGVDGYAVGMGAATVVLMLVKLHYVRRLFPGFRSISHLARAFSPTVPAVAAVLGLRAIAGGRPGALGTAAGLALYLAIVATVTFLRERSLFREFVGYLRPDVRPAG